MLAWISLAVFVCLASAVPAAFTSSPAVHLLDRNGFTLVEDSSVALKCTQQPFCTSLLRHDNFRHGANVTLYRSTSVPSSDSEQSQLLFIGCRAVLSAEVFTASSTVSVVCEIFDLSSSKTASTLRLLLYLRDIKSQDDSLVSRRLVRGVGMLRMWPNKDASGCMVVDNNIFLCLNGTVMPSDANSLNIISDDLSMTHVIDYMNSTSQPCICRVQDCICWSTATTNSSAQVMKTHSTGSNFDVFNELQSVDAIHMSDMRLLASADPFSVVGALHVTAFSPLHAAPSQTLMAVIPDFHDNVYQYNSQTSVVGICRPVDATNTTHFFALSNVQHDNNFVSGNIPSRVLPMDAVYNVCVKNTTASTLLMSTAAVNVTATLLFGGYWQAVNNTVFIIPRRSDADQITSFPDLLLHKFVDWSGLFRAADITCRLDIAADSSQAFHVATTPSATVAQINDTSVRVTFTNRMIYGPFNSVVVVVASCGSKTGGNTVASIPLRIRTVDLSIEWYNQPSTMLLPTDLYDTPYNAYVSDPISPPPSLYVLVYAGDVVDVFKDDFICKLSVSAGVTARGSVITAMDEFGWITFNNIAVQGAMGTVFSVSVNCSKSDEIYLTTSIQAAIAHVEVTWNTAIPLNPPASFLPGVKVNETHARAYLVDPTDTQPPTWFSEAYVRPEDMQCDVSYIQRHNVTGPLIYVPSDELQRWNFSFSPDSGIIKIVGSALNPNKYGYADDYSNLKHPLHVYTMLDCTFRGQQVPPIVHSMEMLNVSAEFVIRPPGNIFAKVGNTNTRGSPLAVQLFVTTDAGISPLRIEAECELSLQFLRLDSSRDYFDLTNQFDIIGKKKCQTSNGSCVWSPYEWQMYACPGYEVELWVVCNFGSKQYVGNKAEITILRPKIVWSAATYVQTDIGVHSFMNMEEKPAPLITTALTFWNASAYFNAPSIAKYLANALDLPLQTIGQWKANRSTTAIPQLWGMTSYISARLEWNGANTTAAAVSVLDGNTQTAVYGADTAIDTSAVNIPARITCVLRTYTWSTIPARTSARTTYSSLVSCPELYNNISEWRRLPPYYHDSEQRMHGNGGMLLHKDIPIFTSPSTPHENSSYFMRWICYYDGTSLSYSYATWTDAVEFKTPRLAAVTLSEPTLFFSPGQSFASAFPDVSQRTFSIGIAIQDDTDNSSAVIQLPASMYASCKASFPFATNPANATFLLTDVSTELGPVQYDTQRAAVWVELLRINAHYAQTFELQLQCDVGIPQARFTATTQLTVTQRTFTTALDLQPTLIPTRNIPQLSPLPPNDTHFALARIPEYGISPVPLPVSLRLTTYYAVSAHLDLRLGLRLPTIRPRDRGQAKAGGVGWQDSPPLMQYIPRGACQFCYTQYLFDGNIVYDCYLSAIQADAAGRVGVILKFVKVEGEVGTTAISALCSTAVAYMLTPATLIALRYPRLLLNGNSDSAKFTAVPSSANAVYRINPDILVYFRDPVTDELIEQMGFDVKCALSPADNSSAQVYGLPIEGVPIVNGVATFQVGIAAPSGVTVRLFVRCLRERQLQVDMERSVNVSMLALRVTLQQIPPAKVLYNTQYNISARLSIIDPESADDVIQYEPSIHGVASCAVVSPNGSVYLITDNKQPESVAVPDYVALQFRLTAPHYSWTLIVVQCSWNGEVVASEAVALQMQIISSTITNKNALPSVLLPSSAGVFVELYPPPVLTFNTTDTEMRGISCQALVSPTDNTRCVNAVIREPRTYTYDVLKSSIVIDPLYVFGELGCALELSMLCKRKAGDNTLISTHSIRIADLAVRLLSHNTDGRITLGSAISVTAEVVDQSALNARVSTDQFTTCTWHIAANGSSLINNYAVADQGYFDWPSVGVLGSAGQSYTLFLRCNIGSLSVPTNATINLLIEGCPEGQQPTTDGKSCTPCSRDTFSFGGVGVCEKCPSNGASCVRGVIALLPGYFPVTQVSASRYELGVFTSTGGGVIGAATLHACPVSEACDVNATNRRVQCAQGYTGVLCASCVAEDGYVHNGHRCVQCASDAINALAFIGLIALLIAWIVYHTVIATFKGRAASSVVWRIAMTYISSLSALRQYSAHGTDVFNAVVAISQLLLSPASMGEESTVGPMACLFKLDFFTRTYANMFIPVLIVGVALVLVLLQQVMAVLRKGCIPQSLLHAIRQMQQLFSTGKLMSLFLLGLFLCYSTVLSAALFLLPCSEPIGGERYMLRAFHVSCSDARYTQGTSVAWTVIILLCVVCPCMLVFFLKRKENAVKSAAAVTTNTPTIFFRIFGFLFSGYRTQNTRWAFTWEAVVLVRRAFIMLIAFIIEDAYTQSGVFAMVITCFIIAQLVVKPYEAARNNQLELFTLLALLFTNCLSMMYFRQQQLKAAEEADSNTPDSMVISAIAILVNGFVLALLVVTYTRLRWNELKENEKAKKLTAAITTRWNSSRNKVSVASMPLSESNRSIHAHNPRVTSRSTSVTHNPMLRRLTTTTPTLPTTAAAAAVSPSIGIYSPDNANIAHSMRTMRVERTSCAAVRYAPVSVAGVNSSRKHTFKLPNSSPITQIRRPSSRLSR